MHSTHGTPLSFSLSKGITKLFYGTLARQWIRIQYIQKEEEKKKPAGEKSLRKNDKKTTARKHELLTWNNSVFHRVKHNHSLNV